MLRTTIFLLLSLQLNAQDSLFIESPVIKDAATSAVTVGQMIRTPEGKLTSIKFWKNEVGNFSYRVTVWDSVSGASLFSTLYKSSTTGWQRITTSLQLPAGAYAIGVYYPAGKYVYTNLLNPRTRGKLIGSSGLFSGGDSRPTARYTASFFVDVVMSYAIVSTPLSVKVLPDTVTVPYGKNVTLTGKITGQYSSFLWEVLEQTGAMSFTGTTTLNPVVSCKDSSGCSIRVMLTATDAAGMQQAEISDVYVLPHPDQWIGVITRGGKVLWLKNVVILD